MNNQSTFYSKITRFALVISAVSALAVSGCASYRISIPNEDYTDIQHKEASMNAYLWGNIMSPLVEPADCEGGINDVIVDDNLGYDFIGVITLGIWKPISIRYRCKAADRSSDSPTFPSGTSQPATQ